MTIQYDIRVNKILIYKNCACVKFSVKNKFDMQAIKLV